ncbi:MAG UNVERIFIED_CONTAM: hypothetical protein LVR29_28170 [Microcystis novacekii LVE1205-3]|jgi:Ca2+-binding RTX toxin-like protein
MVEMVQMTSSAAAGNDNIFGGNGSDLLIGEAGADTLSGGNNTDYLFGGADNDVLLGGAGNDLVYGGYGNDILTGGTGADAFYFGSLLEGVDVIKDFQWIEGDVIQISKSGFNASSLSQFNYNSLTGGLSFLGQQFATIENRPPGLLSL